MRKIFLTALLASTVLTGCSDAYDIDQKGVVTEETDVFRTPEDINKGIRYVYALFPQESEINFDSFFTDELGVGVGNAGQGVNDGSYTFVLLAGNSDAQNMWGSYYGVVNRLNRILNRIDQMTEGLNPSVAADQATINQLNSSRAHAYAIRAYCHYKLFAFFTPDYKNPNGLSVIKFDFLQTDDYTRFEKRSTVAEIVAFIESDIQKVKDLGGIVQATEGTGTGYASNEMLESILVKMYSMLQTPDAYAKLETAFNKLDVTKSVADAVTHVGMFGPGADSADGTEGIFKFNRVSTDGGVQSGVASSWYPAAVGDAPYMEMGRSLYNELDKLEPSQQGEPYNTSRLETRYLVSLLSTSQVRPNYASLTPEQYRAQDLLYIGKYPGITNRPLMNSLWIFRYTDMLLSLAEKRANDGMLSGTIAVGDFSNVESIIYNIRVNRNLALDGTALVMPTNFSTPQAAFARILEERRVEFAFEGQRYLDMKRLGTRAGSPGFVRDPQDCASTNACSLPVNSTKLTMPIPRSEMVSNPNMVQNPGY